MFDLVKSNKKYVNFYLDLDCFFCILPLQMFIKLIPANGDLTLESSKPFWFFFIDNKEVKLKSKWSSCKLEGGLLDQLLTNQSWDFTRTGAKRSVLKDLGCISSRSFDVI